MITIMIGIITTIVVGDPPPRRLQRKLHTMHYVLCAMYCILHTVLCYIVLYYTGNCAIQLYYTITSKTHTIILAYHCILYWYAITVLYYTVIIRPRVASSVLCVWASRTVCNNNNNNNNNSNNNVIIMLIM